MDPGGADLLDGSLKAPQLCGIDRRHPVDAAAVAQRHRRPLAERLHDRTPDVVGRVRGPQRAEPGEHGPDDVVGGHVAGDRLARAVEVHAGFLHVGHVTRVVAALANDREDDLGLAVEPEPDQSVTLADLGLAHGLLERALGRGLLGEQRGIEARVAPERLERHPIHAGVCELPEHDVAEVLGALSEHGPKSLKIHEGLLGDGEAICWLLSWSRRCVASKSQRRVLVRVREGRAAITPRFGSDRLRERRRRLGAQVLMPIIRPICPQKSLRFRGS
jgi:hypothetical protein